MTDRKQRALAWLAQQFVGVTEQGNASIVNKMRKAADGVAAGEPWCVCFLQHCSREVDELFELLQLDERHVLQGLAKTESTQALWNDAPERMRRADPVVGAIVVWRLLSEPSRGHCGIVTEVSDDRIVTVEGNTSAVAGTSEAERNGRGVWEKRRAGGDIPGFMRLGYLLPWG